MRLRIEGMAPELTTSEKLLLRQHEGRQVVPNDLNPKEALTMFRGRKALQVIQGPSRIFFREPADK